MKYGKTVKYIVSLAVAAVLVWLAIRSVDWTSFLDGLKQTRWGFIALFIAASIGALVFRTLRWQALLGPIGAEVRPLVIWDANNIGNLTNIVLPGSGEFVRCGYVATGKARYDKVFGTVLMERIWDILAIVILFVLAICLNRARFGSFFNDNILEPLGARAGGSLPWIAAALAAVLAAALWALWHFRNRSRLCRKAVDAVKGLAEGFGSIAKMRRKWLFALYTAGIWAMYILMCWFVMKAMPALEGLSFVDAIFISAVGNIASIIPVPGGIGAYHYLIALSLSSIYLVPWATGILFATLNHELHAVLVILLGLASYLRFSLRKK